MGGIFKISLGCALMSLLLAIGLAAVTVVPGSSFESLHHKIMLGVGIFFVVWLWMAFWSRPSRAVARAQPPRWLTRVLIGGGVAYLLICFLLLFG